MTKSRIFKNINLRRKADRNFRGNFLKNHFRYLELYSDPPSWLTRSRYHMGTFWKRKGWSSHFWAGVRLLSSSSSFRRALHDLIRQNHIDPGGNISKDQVMSSFSSYKRSSIWPYIISFFDLSKQIQRIWKTEVTTWNKSKNFLLNQQ